MEESLIHSLFSYYFMAGIVSMRLKTLTAGVAISLMVHAAILLIPTFSGQEDAAHAGRIEIGIVHLAAVTDDGCPPSDSAGPVSPQVEAVPDTPAQKEPIKKPLLPAKPTFASIHAKELARAQKPIEKVWEPAVIKTKPVPTPERIDDKPANAPAISPVKQAHATSLAFSDDSTPIPPAGNAPTTDFLAAPPAQSVLPQYELRSPRYHINPAPQYPSLALKRHWQGEVWLRVLVGEQGNVIDAWVENSSGHELLDAAALDTVRNWKFYPAQYGPENVREEVRLPIRFELVKS